MQEIRRCHFWDVASGKPEYIGKMTMREAADKYGVRASNLNLIINLPHRTVHASDGIRLMVTSDKKAPEVSASKRMAAQDIYDVYVALTGELAYTGTKAEIAAKYNSRPAYIVECYRNKIYYKRRYRIVRHGDPAPMLDMHSDQADRLINMERRLERAKREAEAESLKAEQKTTQDFLDWDAIMAVQKIVDQEREAREKEKAKASYTSWKDRHPGVEVVPSKHHGWEMAL